MAGIGRLAGTPWHYVEIKRKSKKNKDGKRRVKENCQFFDTASSFCIKRNEHCLRIANCMYYRERETIQHSFVSRGQVSMKTPLGERGKNKRIDSDGAHPCILFPLGSKVEHVKWGRGTVIQLDDKYVLVEFEDGKRVKLDMNSCIKHRLLKRI